jgi:Tfp pilus assembly protein PilO
MIKIKPRKLKKREWILLLFSFIIIFVAIANGVIRSVFAKVSALRQEQSQHEKALLKLKSIVNEAATLNTAYDQVFSQCKVLRESDNLLQEIERISNRAGANIINIKPTLAKDDGFYKMYSVRIESQDDLPTFARFLYTLTEEIKGIGVERIQIDAQAKDDAPKINMLLNAAVFKD